MKLLFGPAFYILITWGSSSRQSVILTLLSCCTVGDCSNQQSWHSGPCLAAFRPSGPKDRVPEPERGGSSPYPADPLAQDERQQGGQLRGTGTLHGRLQRRTAEGCLCRGGKQNVWNILPIYFGCILYNTYLQLKHINSWFQHIYIKNWYLQHLYKELSLDSFFVRQKANKDFFHLNHWCGIFFSLA